MDTMDGLVVSLEDVKRHLNIELDYTGDDVLLSDYIATAEYSVVSSCGLCLGDLSGDSGKESVFKQVVRMMCGFWYENRSIVSFGQANPIPFGFQFLCRQLMDGYVIG